MRKATRVAVVGSGISGLAVAWPLSRHFQVTLFEAGNYLGGHTNTVDVTLDGITAPVDTGFLVFNDRTCPNLVALFGFLGVPTHAPRRDSVIDHFDYAHPIFDRAVIDAQRELPAIQGKRNTWYCGVWTGYGFHEDGLESAISVANAFGVEAPWQSRELAA